MSFISGSRSAGLIKSAVKSGFGPIFRASSAHGPSLAVFRLTELLFVPQATLIAQTIAVLLARRLGEQRTAKWAAILQFVTGCIGMTIVKKRAVSSSRGGGGGASAGGEEKGKGKGGAGGGLGGASWSGGGSSSFGGGGSGYVVSGGGQQQEGVGYRGKFPTWQPGVDYKVGDHVYFRGKDYAVEQAHKSQVRRNPPFVCLSGTSRADRSSSTPSTRATGLPTRRPTFSAPWRDRRRVLRRISEG